MEISRPLWGEACLAMGRECAAVAVALVSARPAEHFRTSLGGYFHGMVSQGQGGELNLVRTIWGLRQAKAAKVRGASVRAEDLAPTVAALALCGGACPSAARIANDT